MTAITVEDLDNAKLDVDHIAEIATSLSETATDRLGHTKLTVYGAVNRLTAINFRGPWATSTSYAVKDAFSFDGIVYISVVDHVSTSVAADLADGKIGLYQGVMASITDEFFDGVDYAAGSTTELVLSRDPGSKENITVHFGPNFQGPNQYTLSGKTLEFSSVIPAGVSEVFVQIGLLQSTVTPSDGSVGDDQLAWGAILSRSVDSVDDLRALDSSIYRRAHTLGYYAALDGGGSQYYMDAGDTTSADNGGTIIVGLDGGRWKLLASTSFRPEQFGAKGDGSTDDQAQIQNLVDYLISRPTGGKISLTAGKRYILGSRVDIAKQPSKSIVIDGAGATLQGTPGYAGALLYYGEPTGSVGGPPITIRDVRFNSANINSTGLILEWGGASVIKNCMFTGFRQGLSLTNTFALRIDSTTFIDCNLAGILSNNTQAHNLSVLQSFFYNNARDIYFSGASANCFNVILRDSTFEGGANCLVLESFGAALTIEGCYIEGKSSTPFVFGNTVTGFSFQGNWFGFNSGTQTWVNITGGQIKDNVYFDQAQMVDGPSCIDLDISHNSYNGTSNRIYPPYANPTYINGFSDFGAGYEAGGYRRDASGNVMLRGMVTAGADNPAFVLPIGYRPRAAQTFPIVGTTGTTIGRVTVFADGNVTVTRAGSTADLSPVRFTAGA